MAHRSVGAIADLMIAGTHAGEKVKDLLRGLTLEQASVGADCAKGVDPAQGYAYVAAGKYPECRPFENAQGEQEMADFVRRNDQNCKPKPGTESCHKQYHYADIPIERNGYASTFPGARNDDVVQAVTAAITVPNGGKAPAPFEIKDQREALLLLVHHAGDLHQPLHVGAVYLDAKGKRVLLDNPVDPETDTRGGNSLSIGAKTNLHSLWDRVPGSLKYLLENSASE